jgi:hypothetical protein
VNEEIPFGVKQTEPIWIVATLYQYSTEFLGDFLLLNCFPKVIEHLLQECHHQFTAGVCLE